MAIRTFLRIMFDSICNNAITAFAGNFVNFCNNYGKNNNKALKFLQNVPLNSMGTNKKISFHSVTGDKIDCNNVKTC